MSINSYSGLICQSEKQLYSREPYDQPLKQQPLIEQYSIDLSEFTNTYNQAEKQDDFDFDESDLLEQLEYIVNLDMISDNNNNNGSTATASQKSITNTETEYTNLFRGFSTLIDIENIALDRLKSVDVNSNGNVSTGINSETTVPDLADLILQEQLLHVNSSNASTQSQAAMPSSSTEAGPAYSAAPQNSTSFLASNALKQDLSQMNPVELPKITKMPTLLKYPTSQQPIISTQMSTRGSISRMANATGGANSLISLVAAEKVMSTKSSERISLKRLSSTSNSTVTSTTTSVSSPGAPTPSKRGRKPNSANGGTTSSSLANKLKLNQKQELLINQGVKEDKLARFGNKYVEKYTNEYTKRRQNNNVAVQKCRQKLNEKQREREARMKTLDDENKQLLNKVDALSKELNVLKNIIIQMSPTKQLPACLEELIKNLEST
jgi:hypothetical protein